MQKNTNKLIVGAIVVLVLLIFFTVLFRGVFKRGEPSPSPTPTSSEAVEPGVGLATGVIEEDIEVDEKLEGPPNISAQEAAALTNLRGRTPIDTEDFTIGYSPLLNEFFVLKKTDQADEQLAEFLQNQGLFDVYQGDFDLFNEVSGSINEAIVQAETDYEERSTQAQAPTTKRDRDLKLFTDLFKTTLTFDLGGGKSLREVLQSAGDQGASGGGGGGGGNGGGGSGGGGSKPISANAQALLKNPRLTLSSVARQDLQAGIIDERLIDILASMLQDHRIGIWGFKTGHSKYIAGTSTVSNHYYGRAADIGSVDGKAVNKSNSGAYEIVKWTIKLKGEIRPGEVGSPWPEFNPLAGWYSDAAHQNHLHIGYYAK